MKKTLLVIISSLLLTGCFREDNRIFYLSEEHYNRTDFISIDSDELKELENSNESFIVFVYMPVCDASMAFREVVEEFIEVYSIQMYQVRFSNINEIHNADVIRHFPTAIIYQGGKVRAYLDASSNDHIAYYQTVDGFKEWLKQHIYLSR